MAELVAEEPVESVVGLGPGRRLAEARQLQGISREQICEKLKLTMDTLVHLERDDYAFGLPRTFLRGYIRSYANILGLPGDDLVKAFNESCGECEELFDSPVTSKANSQSFHPDSNASYRHNQRNRSKDGMIILGLIILVVFSISTVFFGDKLKDGISHIAVPSQPAKQPVTTQAITTQGEATATLSKQAEVDLSAALSVSQDRFAQKAAGSNNIEPELGLPNQQSMDQDTQQPNVSEQYVVEQASQLITAHQEFPQLKMNFKEECWIKVTDGAGEVLAFGLKKQGKVIELDSESGFIVTLGNASAVTLTFNGEPVNLDAHSPGKRVEMTLQ